MSLAEREWAAALAALTAHRDVVLAAHVNPDGDALGSALALGLGLAHRGGRVSVTFSEPFVVPDALAGLPGRDLLVPPAAVRDPGLLVTLDTASADRLGTVAPLAESAGAVLVVDHHVSNTGFGTLHLVDPEAAATGMLVAELLERLGVPLSRDIADCLYAAIASDTGSFRYAATTPEVHGLAARLLTAGARHDQLSRALFDTHPAGWLPMLADVLGRAAVEPGEVGGLGLVWTAVTAADLAKHDLPADQAESVIDIVRTVENAEVAAVFKELPSGGWAVSLRSKGLIDVGSVCVGLGGGGHRVAAGYPASGPLDGLVAELRGRLGQPR